MTVIAHTGHWLINLIYVGPVVVIVVALSIQSLRDRRRMRREGAGPVDGPAS